MVDLWTPAPPPAASRRRALLVALGIHLLSRDCYSLAGIRFDAQTLGTFWQLVDPALLRDRLLESLLYLHSQPPLFNLFLGVVLKLSPGGGHAAVFQLLYLGFGLGLTACLVTLMQRLGVQPWAACAAASLFAASPAAALYENWLFYTCPVALLLCAAGVGAHRLAERRRARDAALLFGLLAAVVLTRSLFHLAWLALLAAVVAWRVPGRRAVLLGAAVPLALCLGLYLKNLALFGFFGTSSWLGMSLARVVTPSLPDAQLLRYLREGKVSRYVVLGPFGELSDYRRLGLVPPGPPTGIPVLDEERQSTGANNYNHRAYLEISRRYAEDARRLVALAPGALAVGWSHAVFNFFRPASEYVFLHPNVERIARFDRAFNLVVNGQPSAMRSPPRDAVVGMDVFAPSVGWWILASYLLAVLGGGAVLWKRLRAGARDPLTITWAYLWITVVYVAAVGNLLEVDENNRFRFLADPLALAMVAALASSLWRRLRARGGTAPV